MPKKFFTERDIEDMASRGQMTLEVNDNVVLTELAFEKAERLGVKILQLQKLPPAAPIRPYLSQPMVTDSSCTSCSECNTVKDEDIKQRIRDAVKTKLGNQVDSTLLETIITRVLNNVGIK